MGIEREKMSCVAGRNRGQQIEDEIVFKFSGLGEVDKEKRSSWHDFAFEGIFIEVKSAELFVCNGVRNGITNYQSGYFFVDSTDHKSLVIKEGWYCLVYLFFGKPILEWMVPAKEVNHRGTRIFPQSLYSRQGLSIGDFVENLKHLEPAT